MSIKENRRAYAYFGRVDLKQSNKRGYMSRFYSIFSVEIPEKKCASLGMLNLLS